MGEDLAVVLPVIVAGLFALGTRWWLEGGLRKRDRLAIKEELELADLVDGTEQAAQLRDRAAARLHSYLEPPWWRRGKVWHNVGEWLVAVFGVLAMGGFIIAVVRNDESSDGIILTLTSLSLTTLVVLTVVEQLVSRAKVEREVQAEVDRGASERARLNMQLEDVRDVFVRIDDHVEHLRSQAEERRKRAEEADE